LQFQFLVKRLRLDQSDMKTDEVLRLYDRDYGAIYDDSFILGDNFRECAEFEVETIAGLSHSTENWLDVACGTGYFLSRFPSRERAGLDISPAMLEVARRANSGVPFYERDFREDHAEWVDRWDLVSCMWYAYCYADSVAEVDTVVKNLASWTSQKGTLFLPVCDPNIICKTEIPSRPPPDSDDGQLLISGVVWSWIDEPSGRCHANLIAPTLNHMSQILETYFSEVELLQYPRFQADCLQARKAFIARGKM
jgi:SAM-dependent methyltransferase